jgi:6-pyruvoyltetrahydropterin/6-carboxytetrahydropterin synthase
MYELTVEVPFSAAHCIKGHPGRCAHLHGHNYRVVVTAIGEELNDQGMVVDFGALRDICREVVDPLDHTYLNEAPAFARVNPTAENLARHIYTELERKLSAAGLGGVRLDRVSVYESDRSSATYRG